MSKKIRAYIPNKVRPNLHLLFREYLSRCSDIIDESLDYDDILADIYSYYEGDDDFDDCFVGNGYDIIFPLRDKPSRRHRKKGSKKRKCLSLDIPFSGEEAYPREVDDYEVEDVCIYYYPNYSNPFERITFGSLKEFDDFCADEGFIVSPQVAFSIASSSECHTCLIPSSRERGVFELYSASRYEDMVYEVCDVKELSQ